MKVLVRGNRGVSATMFTDVMAALRAMKVTCIYDDGTMGEMPRIWAYVSKAKHSPIPAGSDENVDLILEFK